VRDQAPVAVPNCDRGFNRRRFLGRRTAADKHGRFFMATRIEKKSPNPVDKHVGSRVRMRRMMIAMSQTQLADALGITYQQVQKNESGTNRVAASRLQQISYILQVPVAFFFEGAKASAPHGSHGSALIAQIDDFVASSHGLRLIGAFMRIDNADLRRRIVMLVQEIAGDDGD
jgi:transcriptional regulator with XRE-family HTH domain